MAIARNTQFTRFLALVFIIAAVYFNLTSFVSNDCWWHMKMTEYFIENGKPVMNDPFAVQSGTKILATYPNLVPGLLFLKIYQWFGILGLNMLRLLVFFVFILTLLLLVRPAWDDSRIFLQLILLIFASPNLIVFRPDQFNFLFFTLWIFFLEQYSDSKQMFYLWGILALESLWVNTHPLFFYYGLIIAGIYLGWPLLVHIIQKEVKRISWRKDVFPFLFVSFFWLFNPLGWRSLQSLFVNMVTVPFAPPSIRNSLNVLDIVNHYAYFAIILIFLSTKPWSWKLAKQVRIRLAVIIFALLVPALIYERCWPFLAIFLIYSWGRYSASCQTPRRSKLKLSPILWMTAAALGIIFLFLERTYLVTFRVVELINKNFAVNLKLFSGEAGVSFFKVADSEHLREISLLNHFAESGNCLTNELAIGSAAVWFCPDKPCFWYGHAALINARFSLIQTFYAAYQSGNENALKIFLDKYRIRTLILAKSSEWYRYHRKTMDRLFTLLYMDKQLLIACRKESLTSRQTNKIREL